VLGWLLGGLITLAAAATLAWMLLLPGVVQSRLASPTGAQLRVQGLMGDPFAGRATVTGWTLRASAAPDARVLARGGASEIASADWRAALATDPETGVATIDSLRLSVTEAVLAPDASGAWPLLALAAAAGLPYEKNGPVGRGPRVRVRHLALSVETARVRDARTGAEVPVRIAWQGEFRDVDHTRPLLAALLAAVRTAPPAP
jgi:hypothetical protein